MPLFDVLNIFLTLFVSVFVSAVLFLWTWRTNRCTVYIIIN